MKRKDALRAALLVPPDAEATATPRAGGEASRTSSLTAVNDPAPVESLSDLNEAIRPLTAVNERVPSGAVRAMGLSLRSLSAEADDAATLRAQLASGTTVVDLDPMLVEPSFVADRLDDGGLEDGGLAPLIASLRERGQQVPILVRPHPARAGAYQVAYGHRRLRAARAVGVPVRAIVRSLNDDELVVAQGKENAERRDLSFIERALFARHLEERGFERSILVASLAVQTAEITRYLAVARAVPAEVVRAIGPAPRAGRTRWMALADRLGTDDDQTRATGILAEPGVRALGSDERFVRVFAALAPSKVSAVGRTVATTIWSDPRGRAVARFEATAQRSQLVIDEGLAPEFGAFVLESLPTLFEAFTTRTRRGDSG